MYKLNVEQYQIAQRLFADLIDVHLSIAAVLAGATPGQIWVDNPEYPRVGFAVTPEGEYLTGDANHRACYAALRGIIPLNAYLTLHPESWQTVLGEVWSNSIARKHSRQHFTFREQRHPNWRKLIPDGFELVRVDRTLLNRTELKNYAEVAGRVEEWHSIDYFMQNGFGFCVLHKNAIVSRCIADCRIDDKCEIGIGTDIDYRRRGLAVVAVSAAVDHCLVQGIRHIGWHCLSSNVGSIAVAHKTGFVKTTDCFAYSDGIPAENAGDLTPEEYGKWADYYEKIGQNDINYLFYAAVGSALSGDSDRALRHLQTLIDGGWAGQPELLVTMWVFASIRDLPKFKMLVTRLREKQPDQGNGKT